MFNAELCHNFFSECFFLQTRIFWKFYHISRIYNQTNYRNIFFAKDFFYTTNSVTDLSSFQEIEWQLQINYFLCSSLIDSSHLLNNIYLFKYTVSMTSDSIPILDINTLNNEVFLAINRIRHLWRQRT